MTTRIYANGNRTTALSNLATDLPGYISFDANGVKVLDKQGLRAYLILQTQTISTGAEYVSPADAASSLAAAQNALSTIDSIIQRLDDVINASHWNTRADWPTDTSTLVGGTMVAAVKSATNDCKAKAAAVTAHFADVNNDLADIVTQFYFAEGIDAVVPAGVTIENTTRAVIYTFVTDKGEESAPSEPSDLETMDQNDTADYTAGTVPVDRNIEKIRWYRGQSTNTAGGIFAFVDEVDAETLTYTDSKKDEELGEPCPTITWIEPPADLKGLTQGWNGSHAGFTGNKFCPCEPTVPYAFPDEYKKTTAWPIVGIGTFDQTYVVLTRGKPYFMSGADASALDSQQQDSTQACVSRSGIVSGSDGVYWPSAEGICRASSAGIVLITGPDVFNLFDSDSWGAIEPDTMFAVEHDGNYIFHVANNGTAGCFILHLKTGKMTFVPVAGSAFYRDLVTNTLYLAQGTDIVAMFKGDTVRTGKWKSKVDIEAAPRNVAWLQVNSEFDDDFTVKVYRDGTLTDTKTVTTRKPVRLSSVRAIEHEVEISGAASATSFTVASSVEELKQL